MHFWKYVPYFRKNYKNPIEPETDGNRLTHPKLQRLLVNTFRAPSITTECATFLLIFSHLIAYLQHLSVTQTFSRL